MNRDMKELTEAQKKFKSGLKKLDRFDALREVRPLTPQELFLENKIKEVLYMTVRNYGLDLARKMTQKYRLPNDSYADLCQEMASIFFEKYRNYNPELTTPTTYFVRYFKQVISEYLIKYVHNLSQYDANNVLKVRKVIAYYEAQGIPWTEEMLSIRSGLSLKVVRSTLSYSYISNYAQVEEAIDLRANIKTPEEAFAEKESQEALLNAIRKNTTPEELELFLMRVNPDGSKEMPYEKIAQEKGMSVRQVKRIINTCICRMNQDKELLQHFAKNTYNKYKKTLVLQEDVSDVMEQQLEAFLEEFDNTTAS